MDNGKVGRKVTTGPSEIPPNQPPVSSEKPGTDEAAIKQSTQQLSAEDKAKIKGMYAFDGDLKRAALANVEGVKGKIQEASKTKYDGANGISKSEYEAIKHEFQNKSVSSDQVKWMEKEHPQLHAAITSNLDYEGYTGTAIGSLNSTKAGEELQVDAAKRSAKLDTLPHTSEYRQDGLHKSMPPGDPVPPPEPGETWKEYKTGSNTTFVKNDALSKITDAEAKQSREAQKDFCTRMSGVIGADVQNPPSTKAAQNYFQQMANRGANPDQIKKEYGEYLKTFYRHPGGVNWDPKLDPKNLDKNFKDQPLAKDGKRLVDCEGYAALTESVLGGIKKDGKPMFEIQHGSGPGHVFTGVFPAGGDPRKGFMVNNDQLQDIKWDSKQDKDFNATKDPQARQRFIVRQHWKQEFGEKSSTTDYGPEYTKMAPPSGKLPK